MKKAIEILIIFSLGSFCGIFFTVQNQPDYKQSFDAKKSKVEVTKEGKYCFTDETLMVQQGKSFAEGYNDAKTKCESGDIKTQYIRQQCLDYGYSPTDLHVCPGQKIANDFDYLCNDKHSKGYGECLALYKGKLNWVLNDPSLMTHEKLKQTMTELVGN
jgi:hypothetical protein